jgi:hypothetical protein
VVDAVAVAEADCATVVPTARGIKCWSRRCQPDSKSCHNMRPTEWRCLCGTAHLLLPLPQVVGPSAAPGAPDAAVEDAHASLPACCASAAADAIWSIAAVAGAVPAGGTGAAVNVNGGWS